MQISIDRLELYEEKYKTIRDGHTQEENGLEIAIPKVLAERGKNLLGDNENIKRRKALIENSSAEPADFAFERAIGKNDSVYSNFVELIHNAKSKVGRIVLKDGIKRLGYATGFMVSERLMLTNWHVFKTMEDALDSEIQFNYEYNVNGEANSPFVFKLQPRVFFHADKENDYCFVAVSEKDVKGAKHITEIGYIYMDPSKGKIGNEGEEKLNIIHHPDGDFKQLSIRENKFIKITSNAIWYKSDTAPGSSGSPVFNDQWQLVGLHHIGVAKKKDGKYVDKNGDEIPIIDGKVDEHKVVWIANEGIRISVILESIQKVFPDHPMVKELLSPSKMAMIESNPLDSKPVNLNGNTIDSSDHISINIPSSLVNSEGPIHVMVSKEIQSNTVAPIEISVIEENEIKKLETDIDYSLCRGYQSKFMGVKYNVPIPQPQASISHLVVKLETSKSTALHYHHFSTIMHSIRKMPLISAINVDGDEDKRLDNTERKDVWLRDTRIDFAVQLDDDFYKNSKFDRGHMSRREDANWADTAEDAKRNADLTCIYTNACPQVPKLNQSSRKGLWGQLEKIVLESGALAENGKTSKITVFNGPIFKDNDPVFRGIQVPLEFYKIILWLTDKGSLKATAFKLSQAQLVSEIDFEQLNLNENVEFKPYQCSISELQKLTKIDFSGIVKYDTFKKSSNKTLALDTSESVKALLK